jgi:hypothetical protein
VSRFPPKLLTLFRDPGFSRGKRTLHGLQLLGQRYATLICFGFPDYSPVTFDKGRILRRCCQGCRFQPARVNHFRNQAWSPAPNF